MGAWLKKGSVLIRVWTAAFCPSFKTGLVCSGCAFFLFAKRPEADFAAFRCSTSVRSIAKLATDHLVIGPCTLYLRSPLLLQRGYLGRFWEAKEYRANAYHAGARFRRARPCRASFVRETCAVALGTGYKDLPTRRRSFPAVGSGPSCLLRPCACPGLCVPAYTVDRTRAFPWSRHLSLCESESSGHYACVTFQFQDFIILGLPFFHLLAGTRNNDIGRVLSIGNQRHDSQDVMSGSSTLGSV